MKAPGVLRLLAMLLIPVIPVGALELSTLTHDAIGKLCGGVIQAGILGGIASLAICAAALSLIYLIGKPFLTPTTPRNGHRSK